MSDEQNTNGAEVNAEAIAEQWQQLTRIPFTCKSGTRVVLQPPTMAVYVRAGRAPQALVEPQQQAGIDDEPGAWLYRLSPEDAEAADLHSQRMASGVLVVPRAVMPSSDGTIRELRPGEVDVRRIPPHDLMEIAAWAHSYDGTKPESDEVTRAEASTFREDTGLSSSSADSGEVQSEAVKAA